MLNKIAATLGIVGVLAGFGAFGALPIVTSTASVPGNAFTTGTVDISTSPASALITYSSMAPADKVTDPLTVTTEGSSSVSAELSWDGGISWTAAKTDSTQTASEHTATLGSSTDTWDRTWTPAELSDASFRVRLTSNSSDSLRDFYLDWVPVKVYYGP